MAIVRKVLFLKPSTSKKGSRWLGSRSSASVPSVAILTEAGLPIMTEFDQFIETES